MITYDFIFSNQPRYRISRHVIFWFCWFIFIVFTYHIPMHDVFPNWNIKARMDYTQRINGVDFITFRGGWVNFIWEVSYKQIRHLLCHIAFVYAIIYYILPLYISNKKKWVTTGKLLLIFIAFLALHDFMTYRNIIDSKNDYWRRQKNTPVYTPNFATVSKLTNQQIIFNLSTLVGLTVAIKLLKRWWLKRRETEQIAKEKISAELQLLKAQIHPHFLFNSLNNIYSFALEGSPKAPEMIQKLSGLLHYMLYECKQPLVPLEKELEMIQDYISLEKIRYGERLRIDMQIQQDGGHQVIAPLLLVPFVENSFKHGTSKMLSRPEITLSIIVKENILYFKLTNSRPATIDEISPNGNRGMGLKNVKKRLALLYARRYELQIIDDTLSYTVWLNVVLSEPLPSDVKRTVKKEVSAYEHV